MGDVLLLRSCDPPLDDAAFADMLESGASCFGIYRVAWRGSLLSADGRRIFCHFEAPDAESTRNALRMAGSDGAPWPGTIHDSPAPDAPALEEANVLVERSFAEPVRIEEVQAIEDAGAACLSLRQVTFARTYFSLDRKKMVCLYRAPDAESVREAQRQAGMPVDAVWSFSPKRP